VIPLHIALNHKHSAVAQLLLEHGATAVMNSVVPANCFNGPYCCTGHTALMMCTTADTVKVLLAAGADVHVTTDGGDTCLHKAAAHGYAAPVVCLLIKAGANLHAVNSKGKTAAQVAHDNGFTLIEQLLNRAAQQGH
jgi:ankyrin repeat protein